MPNLLFKRVIRKAKEQIRAKKLLDEDVQETIRWVVLKQDYQAVTVAENQIIYVERDKLYRNKYIVHLKDGTFLETSTQLKEIKELCSDNLVYSHRNYLVNILYITAIQPEGHISKSYNISLVHTSDKVPLTRKNYSEAPDVFFRFLV
ncbi:hypothetical protein EHV15_35100 [Paenibacillus oralis]|uniref:HTH LytTR-type domain-containing protein n=1 Tax=Paenibacillus oralis TaxID=2490856 RepID=A0A3P3TBB4_9BACL|nr:hypothetical protein EHV15_35100 [Paenibacillus oralis]